MPKPLKWNPAVRGHGEVTARSGFRAFVQPAGSGKWRWEVKPVGYEVIDPTRTVGAGTASSKPAAKTAAARLLLAQLDPLKADLEKEFLAGAPMPVFGKQRGKRSHAADPLKADLEKEFLAGAPLPVFGKRSHATKKSPAQLQREINETLNRKVDRGEVAPYEGMRVLVTKYGAMHHGLRPGVRGFIKRVASPDARFGPSTSRASVLVNVHGAEFSTQWPTAALRVVK